ncbi:MAG: nucleotidyltransferase family protein [Sulfurimonas sp.]|nr:nucleotidyltransferase family protein [Sulfurimonas sp.]
MKNIKNIIVTKQTSIIEVLKKIDKSSMQLALVVDRGNKLIGTLSDGDVRRAILKGISLDNSIEEIYFKTPTVANINDTREEIINICSLKKIHQIPIVDNNGNIIGLEILDELIKKDAKTNSVVLMVGGLGTRLRPLTKDTPKPMLHVGGKPILQTIVEKFASYGFINIIMCVNYKSNIIQEHFGDGNKFGVHIEYILEDKRMGTAGALSLIRDKLNEAFFVMNGDLLTNINFEHMMDYHTSNNSIATMGVREYDFQVPYGVVNVNNTNILSIEEKPLQKFFVSGGIYILDTKAVEFIPNDQFYDMPTLFERVIQDSMKCISFPIKEYWLDIGRVEEYEKANREYFDVFEEE